MSIQPAIGPLIPDGVIVTPLHIHADERGAFTEIFRESWNTATAPVQWNAVHSVPNALRGFHLHIRHSDYLVVLSGRILLALRDIRPLSRTRGLSAVLDLKGSHPSGITIPPGVGHAFYFPEPSVHAYAVSEYWSLDDELGCRWDDPGLKLAWTIESPILSPRDANAGSLHEMVELYLASTSPDRPSSTAGIEIA